MTMMNSSSRVVAGWIAIASGLLLVIGMTGFALASSTGLLSTSTGMSPSMMGAGHMGHGMMGSGTSGTTSPAISGATEVRVQATNFSFTPTEIRLPKNADVNLIFVNAAGTGVVHDLTVTALGIHVAANPGETQAVGLRGLTAGRYDAYCGVPGHADLGMRATLIVE